MSLAATVPAKRMLTPVDASSGLIKGQASAEWSHGLFPAYSASGQDVWVEAVGARATGPGIVLSAVGARCGKVFLAEYPRWGTVANTAAWGIARGWLPRYVWYVLNYEDFWIKGGAAQPYVRVPESLTQPVPLFTLEQQVLVASYLDRETAEIDAFIADQEELIGLLAERRAATISRAVTKGLDPSVPLKDSRVEWLGEVPEAWRIQPLWSLFSRVKDVAHPEEPMLSVFRELGVVYKDAHDNLNKTAENRDIYQLVGPGWLVANRMKAWQGSVGISSYRGIVSGHYICFTPRHSDSSEFLNYLFRSRPYAAGYMSLSRGVRIGQAEIDNEQYRLLPVLLPPISDQLAIVSHLDHEIAGLDAAIADARAAITLSRERRAALISAAVTGKIDVREVA